MDNLFVGVPMRLDRGAVESHIAGRVAFAITPESDEARESDTFGGGDLFGRGVQALFRNYLAGRDLGRDGAGFATLVSDEEFLRAVRRLTDAVYEAALATTGADVFVDASPTNASVAELIQAVYPEATIVRSAAEAERIVAPASPPEPAAATPLHFTEPPVFIVGVPRSGTTWLERMLLAHPALAGPERETSLFVSLRALRENARRADGIAQWIDTEALLDAMRRFADDVFGAWARKHSVAGTRLLEKTPAHANHLPLLTELYPDAAIVSIHRDGRDVARSLAEHRNGTGDVGLAAKRWSEITQTVTTAVAHHPQARDERYETMLADPVATVTDLLAWLGLSVDETIRGEIARRSSERVSQYNTTGEIGAGKWTTMPAADVRAVYREAGEQLVALGYVTAAELARARPRVSVNIAVKDRREMLGRCLDGLAAQTFRDFDVVIVDNGSTDGTLEFARARSDDDGPLRITVVENRGSLGAVRNAGVAASTGVIVAFVDSDCVPTPDWLKNGVAVFDRSANTATVQGMTLPEPDVTRGRWYASQELTEFTFRYEACNLFYRREALVEAGGFDEAIGFFGEDSTAGWAVRRLGHDEAFAPDAVVHHAVTHPGLRWHLRRCLRYGNWNALVRKYPEMRVLFWHRYFLRPQSAQTLLALVGAAVTVASVALLMPVATVAGIAAMVPFAWRHRPYTWVRRHALVDALGGAGFDLAIEAGLLWGSIRERTLLL